MKRARVGALIGLGALAVACLRPPSAGSSDSGRSTSESAHGNAAPYAWRNVQIIGGGFVSSIVFSRRVEGLAYARTDVGGVYRLDPKSEIWQPLLDWVSREQAHYLGVESLALDPTDANRVYLAVGLYTKGWAGTGAMLRSKDRGRTWESTNMSIKMGGNEWGRACGERLAVDPNQPSRVFFGSRQAGLLVSEDHGATWETRPGLPAGSYTLVYGGATAADRSTASITLDAQRPSVDVGRLTLRGDAPVQMQKFEVEARQEAVYNSIDRKVYNVGRDITSTTGSASNLLQNVPSVQVDVEGNVSLRGDSGVQILINGKPSALLGRNRAFLLTMAAGSILGTFLGGLLLGIVPDAVLLPALALILVISAAKVWRHK